MGFGFLAGMDFCVGEAVADLQRRFFGVQKLTQDRIISGDELPAIF